MSGYRKKKQKKEHKKRKSKKIYHQRQIDRLLRGNLRSQLFIKKSFLIGTEHAVDE